MEKVWGTHLRLKVLPQEGARDGPESDEVIGTASIPKVPTRLDIHLLGNSCFPVLSLLLSGLGSWLRTAVVPSEILKLDVYWIWGVTRASLGELKPVLVDQNPCIDEEDYKAGHSIDKSLSPSQDLEVQGRARDVLKSG